MKIRVATGLVLGALLVWLSLRGIDLHQVFVSLKSINGLYAVLSLAVMLLMQGLRTVRWGLILSPLKPQISRFTLFSITSVGFLAIVSIPARLGELGRPYLLARRSSIPMSSALGTIFLERVLDTMTVLVIAVFLFFLIPLPPWLFHAGVSLFVVASIFSALMITALFHKGKMARLLDPLVKAFPERIKTGISGIAGYFIDGLGIIKSRSLFIFVVLLSLFIWLADALAIYMLFQSFSMHLPMTAAFVVMIVLIAGIAIPVAPGFIGNWHYFCILALGIFNVSRTDALAFAVVYHALSIGIIILLGLLFLPFDGIPFKEIKNQAKH